jgi:hypothetical protein
MDRMPPSVRPALRRLARRLAIGLFLDVWPAWAAGAVFGAGLAVLVCRLFFPAAAPRLPWLWLAPLLAVAPALFICWTRAYRPDDVVALADWLAGGKGMLLTLQEHEDPAWIASPMLAGASAFTLPRLRPWRRLAPLAPALMFLAVACWLPQRYPAQAAGAALADDIAADLTATVVALKQQDLVTPEEEKKLDEEIDRIRRGAKEKVDASSWEAADALREKVAAGLAEKQDAIRWAEESLARAAGSGQAGSSADANAPANAAELTKALEKLARSGLLNGAPAELQQMLKTGGAPLDPETLRKLAASVSKYLEQTKGRLGEVAKLGKGFGRFDPSEFPVASDGPGDPGDEPGRGGVSRGRADADLTWGKETAPFDRFKPQALPPGAPRSPDDWAPVVELPGAPAENPARVTAAAARQYAAAAGQAAWRRTLAPRHQSAVKKYFEK